MNTFYFDSKKMNINFKAIPIARFSTVGMDALGNSSPKMLTLFEAEPSDGFIFEQTIKKMKDYDLIPNYSNELHKETHKIDTNITLNECKNILETQKFNNNSLFKKAKIFMGICEGQLFGLVTVNVPKRTKNNKIVFSTRDKKHETEIDMLATFLNTKKEKINGLGKILLAQCYEFLRKSKFKSLYLRSELPKNSPYAQKLYHSMGIKNIGKPIEWKPLGCPKSIFDKVELLKEYDSELVQPMSINKKEASKQLNKIFSNFKKETLPKLSVDAKSIIYDND